MGRGCFSEGLGPCEAEERSTPDNSPTRWLLLSLSYKGKEASRDFIDPRPRGPCGRAIFLTQIWDLLSVGSCLETSCNAEACSPPPPAGVRSGESILQWRSKEHRWPGVLKRQEAVCSKPLREEETRMV